MGHQQATISVIVPARNDAAALPLAIDSILAQQGVDIDEVLIVVGPSHDATEAIAQHLETVNDTVRVVANPHGGIPQALNAGLRIARGDIIVRVDAHSVLPVNYCEIAVETMGMTGAVNVAAVQVPTGVTPTQRGIAAAMAHRVGSGAAAYREGLELKKVETGFLGVYDTAALRSVGGWDELFARNEDAELNIRLQSELGREIWLDPRMKVAYAPRATIAALAKQYWHYGRWRQQTVRRHPHALKLRQLAAPFVVMGLAGATVAAMVISGWALVIPVAYVVALGAVAVTTGGLTLRERVSMAMALAAMHIAWGAGFLRSCIRRPLA